MRPEDTEMIANNVHSSVRKQLLTNFNHSKLQGQTDSILCSYRKVVINWKDITMSFFKYAWDIAMCHRYGKKQRWSRGHKARGQGQGHKKISRPRPKTYTVEAKAKGTDASVLKKKKKKKNVFKIFFRRKRSLKTFFQAISTWGNQKKGLCRFSARFLAFSNEISTVQK